MDIKRIIDNLDNEDDTVDNQYYSYLNDKNFNSKHRSFFNQYGNSYILDDNDFYPPSDDRYLESYVEDIEDGDNFADYCKYIFAIYEKEGYYD